MRRGGGLLSSSRILLFGLWALGIPGFGSTPLPGASSSEPDLFPSITVGAPFVPPPDGAATLGSESIFPKVAFAQSSFTVRESQQFASFSLRLVRGYIPYRGSFDILTADGTALAGRDYLPLKINYFYNGRSGGASAGPEPDLNIRILDNRRVDGPRTILLLLTNLTPRLELGSNAVATLTILDDDTAAGHHVGFNAPIFSSAAQPDGRIVVGGEFTYVDGLTRNRIARIDAEGLLDETFDPGGGFNGAVRNLLLDSSGKIIVVGDFTEFSGTARKGIARLNPSGSLDSAFGPDAGWVGQIGIPALIGLAQQSNGNILIGGTFTNFNRPSSVGLVRLNEEGSVDESFSSSLSSFGGWPGPAVLALAVQPDQKILMAGRLSRQTDERGAGLRRLNPDGSDDSTFTNFSWNIGSLAHLPDGKILAAVDAGTSTTGPLLLARYQPDGRLDRTFEVKDITGAVSSITPLPDGRILVTGRLSSAAGLFAPIARLKPNGQWDNTFKAKAFSYSEGSKLALVNDRIVVGGSFSFGDHFVERFNLDGTLVEDLRFLPLVLTEEGSVHLAFRGQASTIYTIDGSNDFSRWVPLMTNTQPRAPLGWIEESPGSMHRFYRITGLSP